jgi:hypothetical protein
MGSRGRRRGRLSIATWAVVQRGRDQPQEAEVVLDGEDARLLMTTLGGSREHEWERRRLGVDRPAGCSHESMRRFVTSEA